MIVVSSRLVYISHMRCHFIQSSILLFVMASTTLGQAPWERKLRLELPLLGHRNWIVIADSAYPLQTAPGIESTHTETDQLAVLSVVLG